MTKQEFIEKLRLALNGKVPANVIMENIRYYEDYINTEVRKGKSEEEVLAALGDPRLIARTIITASAQAETVGTEEYREYGRAAEPQGRQRKRMPMWMWLVFGILIIVLIFSAVMSLLSLLWPILVPMIIIMAVMGVVKFFRDWVN
ncbi:MAG: DUF1700 domain-containing protein [Eubacterium sp.]|nr:DUF1700 domain-containing protein [Eubacterium sp.]MCM1240783.1 DUF1700 domain-containing protein [Lachnospiraceae bacterium]MCM1304717.1 DUF1700 domain-containing protein [Butyrivibrio sp.]MCM1344931.1 DUF1700 domain-containing protein [Muribaculaceae bacterium]MCM1240802.1 DUF1700 domain-containing protein [Lachnospiraceae bacterium]